MEENMTIKPIANCTPEIRKQIDVNTYWVAFSKGKPVAEVSHRDGKYWTRAFGAPRSVPFRPSGTTQDVVKDDLEMMEEEES